MPLLAVVGATGTGKSELGLRLAERLGGEIINADALQFYRGMDIGTAKLSVAEREGVPHHLLDILDVVEEASVSDFQGQARALIDDIRGRGAVPILVGGSGLYVRAALDVLEFPGTDPELRATLEAEAASHGLAPLRERLRAVDPVSAERLQDERRVIRALEVHQLTGRPFSSFMPTREYVQPTLQLGLVADREVLKERLARRVHRMVAQGLQDEVRALDARGLRQGKTACRAIGYAQFLAAQDGDLTVAEAVEDTIVATRKFARRQLTWFRADPRIHWLDWTAPDLVDQALRRVEEAFPGSVS
ncbi:tRNA (adenosine(37)-N6)-dimethylallyltransferase MiaA [Arthrobacter sp. Y-9]|uniref:tRNA (adenosine(37)-N6)-dimethylallyltransferase MiaA n=1 Tax=Arthrobacter sp. Y-9 TaxID=3039385 RepID=UPI0024201183|nr:tRNA (adenosine(37)-N6)-dimethylallyltransferase MiaA [Arthrobacter sp. Y-9]WFR85569.1 tRNA (adenosine(37)-N6)-dimethylallyltransferase MiaA [Arthrobacter sp. Y-9]